jgi:putative transposase
MSGFFDKVFVCGSQTVQQQALRDFDRAMRNFFAGTHRRPTWRKAGRHEGFRIVAVRSGRVRRLSRKVAAVWVPKAGWVRFRWSRPVPDGVNPTG